MKPRITKLENKFLLTIILIIAFLGICSIVYVNWQMRSHARKEAKEKAKILLNRNLATHTYFSHQLKPTLFKNTKGVYEDNYFEPTWMSSTYAVREIDKYYQPLSKMEYYYKEAAINARSPENEADEFEKLFLRKLNKTSDIQDKTEIRVINGKPFFVTMTRGESMEKNCLRCHSEPDLAPQDLVAQYGPARSFNRFEGEVVSAISIKIPLESAYEDVKIITTKLSTFFVITLLLISGAFIYLNRKWFFSPLESIRRQTEIISNSPEHLGEEIELPTNFEFFRLIKSFNAMSTKLRQEREFLELNIHKRTKELNTANLKLGEEIGKHQNTIEKLELSLKELKSLRGILPFCSYCKSIRDDSGYWNKVDYYIQTHSEADISHSICPKCAKKHYPDYNLDDD